MTCFIFTGASLGPSLILLLTFDSQQQRFPYYCVTGVWAAHRRAAPSYNTYTMTLHPPYRTRFIEPCAWLCVREIKQRHRGLFLKRWRWHSESGRLVHLLTGRRWWRGMRLLRRLPPSLWWLGSTTGSARFDPVGAPSMQCVKLTGSKAGRKKKPNHNQLCNFMPCHWRDLRSKTSVQLRRFEALMSLHLYQSVI